MPDVANIHIDIALTNVSVGYTNEDYVREQVFPIVSVPKRSNKYFLYTKDAFIRSSGVDGQGKPQSIRRPGARSTEILFEVSNSPFFAEQLAKSYALTDAETRTADVPLQPEIDATIALTEMIKLDEEIQVANKTHKRANYNTGNKVQLTTGTTSWAAATGKPISVDIPAGKKAVIAGIIRAATNMLVNYASAVTLSQNAEYLDKVKYTSRDGLTKGGLAPIIGGLEIIEARAQKATSIEGAATVTNGYVWVDDQATPQDSALIFYRNSSAAQLRGVFFGLTFDAPDDTYGTHGVVIKRWREEWRDAEMIEARSTQDWRFVCTDGSASGDNGNGFATGAYLVSGTTL